MHRPSGEKDWDRLLNRRAFLERAAVLGGALSLGLQQSGHAAALPVEGPQYNVRRLGATGNGRTNDTVQVQRAIDSAASEGGCIYFPPGRYLCGTLRLHSHVSLHLESGATLVASPQRSDFDDYEKLGYNSFSDSETTDFNYALIRGREVEHVAILGPGRIDMARTRRGGPKPIALKLCKNVLIRDLTIENAPNYNVSLLGCEFVNIRGVTIRNGYCDGIDPDCCRHVRISDCFIESWDDAIVPKASPSLGYLRPTEHLTVTNCVLTTACNALKLGTESSGGFKDILFSNCTIFSTPQRWNGRRATSGLSLEMVDGGKLERVTASNLIMRDVRAPLFVRLGNRGRGQKLPLPEHLRDILISDVVATGAILSSSVLGLPGFPVKGVTLKNIRVTTAGGGKSELALQRVPEREAEYPDAGRFGDLPAYGLYCRHVEDLTLDGLSFEYEGAAEGRPGLMLDDVRNVDVRMVRAEAPAGEQPVIRLNNVRDCLIQGCRAQAGTKIWAAVSGPHSTVREMGNDFSQAHKGIELGAAFPEQ